MSLREVGLEIRAVIGDITGTKADAIIVNLFEGVERPEGATGSVDRALDNAISQLIAQGEVKGKLNEVTILHTLGKLPAARVAIAGLGKPADLTPDRIRGVSAEACRRLRDAGAKQVATIAHGAGQGGVALADSAQAVTEGAVLGLYTFKKHQKKENSPKEITELQVVDREQASLAALDAGIAKGRTIAEAVCLARDMVNEPANFMTPTDMAEAARKVAFDHGLDITVMGPDEIKSAGMGGLAGVAQGSAQPPCFIILRYKGNPASKSTLGLVGKGLTFDSGGISIKPSERMEEMKTDMSGGASVIAAMKAIAQLKPKINVTALVPATENLPDGKAYKPGDVLKAMNGKTIEIISTDAEGRVILADALAWARKEGLSPVMDAATLTGACIVALGNVCSGSFTNNQPFLEKVAKAAGAAGERAWQMPMYDDYKELNKSDVADMKNAGTRYGGAIAAAQFLAEFIEDTPWVHLDIAGTAFTEKTKGYQVKGATGVPVRTFVNLALDMAE